MRSYVSHLQERKQLRNFMLGRNCVNDPIQRIGNCLQATWTLRIGPFGSRGLSIIQRSACWQHVAHMAVERHSAL